jgi:hypothetical protein
MKAGRAFLVRFIQKYDPGDRITQSRDLTYQLPLRGR